MRKHRLLQNQCWRNLPKPKRDLDEFLALPSELMDAQNCHSCGKDLPQIKGLIYCPFCAKELDAPQGPQTKRRKF